MSAENETEAVVETEFKVTDLFRLYKAANALVHAEETPDLEAKVKFVTNTGDEFLVTSLKMEVSEDTEETIVWLEGVIDE